VERNYHHSFPIFPTRGGEKGGGRNPLPHFLFIAREDRKKWTLRGGFFWGGRKRGGGLLRLFGKNAREKKEREVFGPFTPLPSPLDRKRKKKEMLHNYHIWNLSMGTAGRRKKKNRPNEPTYFLVPELRGREGKKKKRKGKRAAFSPFFFVLGK